MEPSCPSVLPVGRRQVVPAVVLPVAAVVVLLVHRMDRRRMDRPQDRRPVVEDEGIRPLSTDPVSGIRWSPITPTRSTILATTRRPMIAGHRDESERDGSRRPCLASVLPVPVRSTPARSPIATSRRVPGAVCC